MTSKSYKTVIKCFGALQFVGFVAIIIAKIIEYKRAENFEFEVLHTCATHFVLLLNSAVIIAVFKIDSQKVKTSVVLALLSISQSVQVLYNGFYQSTSLNFFKKGFLAYESFHRHKIDYFYMIGVSMSLCAAMIIEILMVSHCVIYKYTKIYFFHFFSSYSFVLGI